MAYGGTTTIASDKEQTKLVANGQVTYDAVSVAEKIKPWTGNYLTIAGQRTEPVELVWISNSKNANWADSLQAKMQVGWDSANLVGINIGKADVPLEIQNGQFRSKTTIPVSKVHFVGISQATWVRIH